ncbi:DUF1289 domain-containing protein [Undibacterium sp. Xuan67W]|uniref:DUF1289 domain-containing protein n=1 Tax=Undibacterium sp. Xuan67W TaxID=3413057 RepID=UPI003BF3FC8F
MSILYDYDPTSAQAAVNEVPSPCVGICKMNEKRSWCVGCFRSIDEITMWSRASNDTKRRVWIEIKQRMFEPG